MRKEIAGLLLVVVACTDPTSALARFSAPDHVVGIRRTAADLECRLPIVVDTLDTNWTKMDLHVPISRDGKSAGEVVAHLRGSDLIAAARLGYIQTDNAEGNTPSVYLTYDGGFVEHSWKCVDPK